MDATYVKIKLEGPWCLPNDPNAARIGICITISENYYFTLKIKNEDNRGEINPSLLQRICKRENNTASETSFMGKQRENHASSTKELRDSFIYVRNRQELGSVCMNISFK